VWPWDHVAVGYLCYSGLCRLRCRAPPTDGAAVAVVFGSLFPDLVDKPLSWTFAVVPVFTHTLVVALPLSATALLISHRVGIPDLGRGFVAGYLLHLAGDLLFPLVTDGVLGHRRLLWPFLPYRGEPGVGLVEATLGFLGSYAGFLTTPAAAWYMAANVALLGGAVALWVADGRPGVPD
jgi:hypothetical protein